MNLIAEDLDYLLSFFRVSDGRELVMRLVGAFGGLCLAYAAGVVLKHAGSFTWGVTKGTARWAGARFVNPAPSDLAKELLACLADEQAITDDEWLFAGGLRFGYSGARYVATTEGGGSGAKQNLFDGLAPRDVSRVKSAYLRRHAEVKEAERLADHDRLAGAVRKIRDQARKV